MSGSRLLVEVEQLSIRSRAGTIVTGLDLAVAPGETIGVVGESGSGKSMTARALVGLLPQGVSADGSVRVGGRELIGAGERELRRVRGREVGLILQDPFTMLSPLRTIGKQITDTVRTASGGRLTRSARRAEAIRRLEEVGIDDRRVVDRFPFQLSGGMRQRVGLAAALASDPEILVADEPSTALDVTTQKEILALLRSIQQARGMGVVLITHDLRVAFAMCQRIYVLYAGSVLEVASGAELEEEPLHPYTLGLLLSEPQLERRLDKLNWIPGNVPPADGVAGRCPFSTRCAWVEPACLEGSPPLAPLDGRLTACRRIGEIRRQLSGAHAAARREAELRALVEPSDPIIAVTNLHKRFPARSEPRAVVALDGVSITVGDGESVGVVGESGSGKTTLARCLVGLETPSEGLIQIGRIDASDYAKLGELDRRRLRQTVQMVFQDPYSSLNPTRTVGSTLKESLARLPDPPPDAKRAVAELLGRVGLPAVYAARKPSALSGGERQRVAIARSLALRPRILVCDEPVSALDVSVQAQILNLLEELREEIGLGYLFITHDLAVVRQIADRLYVLHRGRVVEQGPIDQVLDRPRDEYTRRLVASVPRTETTWLDAPGASRQPTD